MKSCRVEMMSYTVTAKVLHWLMAIMIIAMLMTGWSLDDLDGADLSAALSTHATGGGLVLVLLVMRVLWRVAYPPPELPQSLTTMQKLAAGFIHVSLYVMLLLVPLTGLTAAVAHSENVVLLGGLNLQETFAFIGQNGFDIKREIHAQAMHVLLALIIGHVAAAVVHRVWLKDGIFERMTFQRLRA